MWKILVAHIRDDVNYLLVCRGQFLEKQNKCHKEKVKRVIYCI